MPCPYHKVLIEERSGRSAREISMAAVGHESAVRSLRRGLDMRVSTVLVPRLGSVDPPRSAGRNEHADAARGTRGAPPASDEKALGKLLGAIARTFRMARTRAQREVLLMSLSSSRKFVDDWIAGRPQMVEEYEPEEWVRPPATGRAGGGLAGGQGPGRCPVAPAGARGNCGDHPRPCAIDDWRWSTAAGRFPGLRTGGDTPAASESGATRAKATRRSSPAPRAAVWESVNPSRVRS